MLQFSNDKFKEVGTHGNFKCIWLRFLDKKFRALGELP